MTLTPNRYLHLLGFFLCMAALLISIFFMEMYLGLAPCPLCIISRLIVAAQGLLFFFAALHNPKATGRVIYSCFGLAISGLGIATSARHIWLQNLPANMAPDCTPDLAYLVDKFPPFDVLSVVLNTSGECAEVSWTLLGLSIPWQTLMLFVALVLINLLIISRVLLRKNSPLRD